MTSLRKTSLTAGVLYLITFVSIPTLSLYSPVKEFELHRRLRRQTLRSSSAASWKSSWPWPASAPPSRCTR